MLNISEDQLKFTNRWMFLGKANNAPLATLPEKQLKLRNLLAAYNKEDIYNADEMGLFFEWNLIKHSQTLYSHTLYSYTSL
ncbi:hypothetical protein RhiirC2_805372 [Rhizophagus irregularis]|uniref:Uncharacterized protein n=1 Tax=Rhizophagus irregularis TaxID=588596 RepID=A0A2N1KUC4_9GLOM|nr:hypothetical protein RhiirC2_805372 [Rhizophagus irregularis]